jgi:hypothetical protein
MTRHKIDTPDHIGFRPQFCFAVRRALRTLSLLAFNYGMTELLINPTLDILASNGVTFPRQIRRGTIRMAKIYHPSTHHFNALDRENVRQPDCFPRGLRGILRLGPSMQR